MKVMFDTNVYISFIRNGSHEEQLLARDTVKYISAIVLMELWAGAKDKNSERLLYRLQKPYINANRVLSLAPSQYISIGQFLADLPNKYKGLCRKANFLNDLQIAFTALSIGARLYTQDIAHYEIISQRLPGLRVRYVSPA